MSKTGSSTTEGTLEDAKVKVDGPDTSQELVYVAGGRQTIEDFKKTLDKVRSDNAALLQEMMAANASKKAIRRKVRNLAREYNKRVLPEVKERASDRNKDDIRSLQPSQKKARKKRDKFGKSIIRERLNYACNSSSRIVMDMAFVKSVPQSGVASLAQQTLQLFGHNARALQPSKIIMAGINSATRAEFSRRFAIDSWVEQGTMVFDEQPFEKMISEKDIVYLSSDATDELQDIDPNKAYIIGGILDRNAQKGATVTKATNLGVVCAKLPLDTYLNKRGRSHSKRVLATNHVAQIIIDMSCSGDWDFALDRNVPTRKIGKDREDSTSLQVPSWRFLGAKPPVAMVVGASSGIGFSFAKRFRLAGWTVIMVARNSLKLRSAANKLREIPVECHESGLSPIVLTAPDDCSQWGGALRVCEAIEGLWPSVDKVDCVVAASGTFKWDDDPIMKKEPNLLMNQNLASKAVVLKESLRLMNTNINYRCRISDENWFDFEIQIDDRAKKERFNSPSPRKPIFICIGSDAGSPGFQDRVDHTENELKYIESMQGVRRWCLEAQKKIAAIKENAVKIELIEPPLVDTPMSRREFQRLGKKIDWNTVPTSDEYVSKEFERILEQKNGMID